MKRIFLDANVLFSGSNPESAVHELIRRIGRQAHPVSSNLALEEARRNIRAKRPKWQQTFRTITEPIEIVRSVTFRLPVKLNDKDAPILCTAIRHNCDYLVTGDKKDFGHLLGQTIQGVYILAPIDMAEALEEM